MPGDHVYVQIELLAGLSVPQYSKDDHGTVLTGLKTVDLMAERKILAP
jgi:hypothetical protein